MRPGMQIALRLALAILLVVVGIEIFAATTNLIPTWSEMMWMLDDRYVWFGWALAILFIVLFGHFIFRWWGPPRRRE